MTKLPKGIVVKPTPHEVCQTVATRIIEVVQKNPWAVLGLATGQTMVGVYAELVRLRHEKGADFSRVTTFNLDEYYPIKGEAPQSFARFMKQHLFNHIKFSANHVPDGSWGTNQDLTKRCKGYERAIDAAGGIDLQVLGLGLNGHIGYNEPGSMRHSRTRIIKLSQKTREGITGFGLKDVPEQGITMGIDTIMQAREIVMLATGAAKAEAVLRMMTSPISPQNPSTFLREHPNVNYQFDAAAAAKLAGFTTTALPAERISVRDALRSLDF